MNVKWYLKTEEVYQFPNRDGLFDVVARLRAGCLRYHRCMLGRGKRPFSSKRSSLALDSTQTPIQWIIGALTRRVSRPRSDSNHIPQVLSFILSTPISPFPIIPSGMHTDNLIFTCTTTVQNEINPPFCPARDLSYSWGWQYCRPGR